MIILKKGIATPAITDNIRDKIVHLGGGEIDVWSKSLPKDKLLFEQIYLLIFSDDPRLAWHACWIVDKASEQCPNLLNDKITQLIKTLLFTQDRSIKRHLTRILCRSQIPDVLLGDLVSRSFDLLQPAEAVAVRVNAMQLLFNITQYQPDLKGELASVLEMLLEEGGSAGFVNRSSKLLKQLRS